MCVTFGRWPVLSQATLNSLFMFLQEMTTNTNPNNKQNPDESNNDDKDVKENLKVEVDELDCSFDDDEGVEENLFDSHDEFSNGGESFDDDELKEKSKIIEEFLQTSDVHVEVIQITPTTADLILKLPIDRLPLNQQQLDALGMIKGYELRVEFSLHFNRGVIVPQRITQINPLTLEVVDFQEEVLFLQRLTTYFDLLRFYCVTRLYGKESEMIRSVMTSFYCSETVAISALKLYKWDLNDTVLNLYQKQSPVIDCDSTPTPADSFEIYLDELSSDPTHEALILSDLFELRQRSIS
jgi:hypothetical protein